MNLAVFSFIFFSFLQFNMGVFAQISLRGKDLPIEKVFESIYKQTGYQFVYNYDLLKNAKKINVDFKNAPLATVLEQSFKDQPFTYSIVDSAIIIRKIQQDPQIINNMVNTIFDRKITGTVKDGASGKPVAGATVMIKETGKGTSTDNSGNFSLDIPEGKKVVLVISSIGYEKRETTVEMKQTVVNVKLKAIEKGLDEVVVTGFTTQEKRTLTGSLSELSGKTFENTPMESFDKMMQGKMPGVLVQGGSGGPGGAQKITIRGEGSISAGTSPLIIIDGQEFNSTDGPTNVMSSDPLSSIDPNDIESITVLKDAAAASIYGAQAGNGVILITTKKGQAGKTRFGVNYYHGITEPVPSIPVLNSQQYLRARMDAVKEDDPDKSDAEIRSQVLAENHFPLSMTDSEIAALPSYDWQDAIFNSGTTDRINASMSGGTAATTFRLSSSYQNTGGNVIGNDFQRGSMALNLNHKINSKVNVSGNFSFSLVKRNGSYGSNGSNGYFSSPQYAAPFILPFIPVYLDDGSYNAPLDLFPGDFPYNPVQFTDLSTISANTKDFIGNFKLEYKIANNLVWNSQIGMDYRIYETELFQDPRVTQAVARQGYRAIRNQGSATLSTSHTLTYTRKFMGGHNFKILGGVEYRSYSRHRSDMDGEGFPTYQFNSLSAASTILGASESFLDYKTAGAFGQLNYNYMTKYLFSAVLRRDGSSRFGENNRYGWFPAVSVGWDISREGFLRSSQIIDQLKLRASYGATGNSQISSYAAIPLFDGTGSYDGKPGIQMTQLGNPELKWEKNVEANIGVDYSLFDRRINGSIDIFHRRSADLLLSTPLPWSSGYSSIYRNVGVVVNRGLEIAVNTVNIDNKNFKWNTSFNISFQRNRVKELYMGVEDIDEAGDVVPVQVLPGNSEVRVGYSLETNFRSQYAGVNPATGRPMWWYGKDKISYIPGSQGSTSYTPYGRGTRLSAYYGGFINNFTYQDFGLDVVFQYDMGRELYNSNNVLWYETGSIQRNGRLDAYLARWQEPGQLTAFPIPIDGKTQPLAAASDISSSRYLEDASYIRLKEVTLSYKLPKDILRKIKFNSVKIYVSAVNILTFTKWTGYDPEFYISDSDFDSNRAQIPPSRVYTMGVSLSF